jgi:outer membrane protein TolC
MESDFTMEVFFVKKKLISLLFLVVLVFSPFNYVFAATDQNASTNQNQVVLTLQQAVDMGLENDQGVKSADLEIDRTKELRDSAAENIKFFPSLGSGNDYSTKYQLSWNNLLSADLTWQMSKKQNEVTRDSLALQITKSYWDVQNAEENLNIQQLLKKKALTYLQNAQVGYQVGVVSHSDAVNAETQWNQAKAAVDAAQKNLDGAYSAFDKLIGISQDERPILSDSAAYEPLIVNDLESEAERIADSSPNVWLTQQKVTIQKWAADMASFTGQYEPYEARKIGENQAELNADNALELTKQGVRNLYYAIVEVEKSYDAAQESLKIAEENLTVAKAKYDAGVAIQSDLISAEVAVVQAQQQIDSLVRQHAYLRLAFEKPWAVSGNVSSNNTSAGN